MLRAMAVPIDGSQLLDVLGRAHVAVVHFPIALLVVAAALEFVARVRSRTDFETSIQLLARLGALAAIVAAALGWLHAEREPLGGSAHDTLERHRWIGNFAAGFACIAVACTQRRNVRFAALALAASLVGVAGHLGGELVHGSGYLSLCAQTDTIVAQPPADVTTPTRSSFADVQALFATRCIECHGEHKQKGKLRLDRFDAVWFEPGEYGVVVERKSPDASELYRRLVLPLEDEDHMPPKKEAQPTQAEIETVRAWIAAGALP